MQQLEVVVCDEDADYGRRLSEYWMDRQELSTVRFIGQREEFVAQLEAAHSGVWLISAKLLQVWDKTVRKGRMDVEESEHPAGIGEVSLICLAEETVAEELAVYPCICKYQSADEILRQVYRCLAGTPVLQKQQNYKTGCVIGLCAPWYDGSALLAGLALCGYLSRKGKVLYINSRGYHGFCVEEGMADVQNLSDIILSLRKTEANAGAVVRSAILTMGETDYVVPVQAARQLEGMEAADLVRLLEVIRSELHYEYIVLELNPELPEIEKVLEQCGRRYGFLSPSYGTEQMRQMYSRIMEKWDFRIFPVPLPLYTEGVRMSGTQPELAAEGMGTWIEECMEEEVNADGGRRSALCRGDKEDGSGTHGCVTPDGR